MAGERGAAGMAMQWGSGSMDGGDACDAAAATHFEQEMGGGGEKKKYVRPRPASRSPAIGPVPRMILAPHRPRDTPHRTMDTSHKRNKGGGVAARSRAGEFAGAGRVWVGRGSQPHPLPRPTPMHTHTLPHPGPTYAPPRPHFDPGASVYC